VTSQGSPYMRLRGSFDWRAFLAKRSTPDERVGRRQEAPAHARFHSSRVSASNLPKCFFWAVVCDESDRVIEFFPTRRLAEKMLAETLGDEPDWRAILRVEKESFGRELRTKAFEAPSPFLPASAERRVRCPRRSSRWG